VKNSASIIFLMLVMMQTQGQDYFISLPDQDSNHYATVQIGNQIWMAENLNVGTSLLRNVLLSPGTGSSTFMWSRYFIHTAASCALTLSGALRIDDSADDA
jgi:hypothetical protein